MSASVFETLPGVETPVADVHRALAAVWDTETAAPGGKGGTSEFRASQMNLVVHFGLDTTPAQAKAGFDTALEFSRRYPCRIIVLCPWADTKPVAAKIFCECFVGASRSDMTCTEAIILAYPLEQRAYLEDQASILLESDLPIFYWPQNINRASRLGDYRYFLKSSQRIVIDSGVEKPEVTGFAWPRPEIVQDLAWGRVLPLRQSMGHFLSYIPAARLAEGLKQVEVRHQPKFASEARALEQWIRRGLGGCAKQTTSAPASASTPAKTNGSTKPELPVATVADERLADSIAINWTYESSARLTFNFDVERGAATLESTFDCEPIRVAAAARLLPPEKALAEVLFF